MGLKEEMKKEGTYTPKAYKEERLLMGIAPVGYISSPYLGPQGNRTPMRPDRLRARRQEAKSVKR